MEKLILSRGGFNVLTISEIKQAVSDISEQYPIKKISIFGSYADGTATEESDIDMIVEFNTPNISLLTLSDIRYEMMDRLHKDIDVIHGPLESNAMIQVDGMVSIYG